MSAARSDQPVLKVRRLDKQAVVPRRATEGSAGYDLCALEAGTIPAGTRKVIATGGRYDNLVENLGAPHQIPAVGGAIALERLREAAGRQAARGEAR